MFFLGRFLKAWPSTICSRKETWVISERMCRWTVSFIKLLFDLTKMGQQSQRLQLIQPQAKNPRRRKPLRVSIQFPILSIHRSFLRSTIALSVKCCTLESIAVQIRTLCITSIIHLAMWLVQRKQHIFGRDNANFDFITKLKCVLSSDLV